MYYVLVLCTKTVSADETLKAAAAAAAPEAAPDAAPDAAPEASITGENPEIAAARAALESLKTCIVGTAPTVPAANPKRLWTWSSTSELTLQQVHACQEEFEAYVTQQRARQKARVTQEKHLFRRFVQDVLAPRLPGYEQRRTSGSVSRKRKRA